MRSSRLLGTAGPAECPSTALLRIEFTAPFRLRTMGELLPRLSTLTAGTAAVYLCCTCPKVALGGRYPLSLPYGARTFLVHGFSSCVRGCPFRSQGYFKPMERICQPINSAVYLSSRYNGNHSSLALRRPGIPISSSRLISEICGNLRRSSLAVSLHMTG